MKRIPCFVVTLAAGAMGLTAAPLSTLADDTNARKFVQDILKNHGAVPVRSCVTEEHCTARRCPLAFLPQSGLQTSILTDDAIPDATLTCETCGNTTTCTTKNKILGFGPISLEFGEVTFGKPVFKSLPDKVYVTQMYVQNCTDLPQVGSSSKSLSLSMSTVSSTTVTKTISKTIAARVQVSYNTAVFGNYSAGVNYSETITNSTSNTAGVTQAWSDTTSINVGYPKPRTAVAAQFKAAKLSASVPFAVDALVDTRLENNEKRFKFLSDITTSEQRRLKLEGVLNLQGASTVISAISDTAYDEARCESALDGIAEGPLAVDDIEADAPERQIETFEMTPEY
ncbi:porin [Sinorhizobium meliloti]|uniref:porin n=1 Tax=Rhizobium meliloti TaxID=382 RepID=UPI000FD84DE9|nr:porin [Sinorhizobium meliloti]RVE88359.1 hypothetical protein CN238_16080 [Sinorhizobium meliloti]RVH28901.1 hypothetical protein CN214_17190 [Sinorhizobium meliloti]